MGKCVFVLDEVPASCVRCPMFRCGKIHDSCVAGRQKRDIANPLESRPDWCPAYEISDYLEQYLRKA